MDFFKNHDTIIVSRFEGDGNIKKLLIVVDFQKDFIDGSLGFAHASSIEEFVCEKIAQFRREAQDVLFTLDTHEKDYMETQEGQHLPVPHCIKGSAGHQLYGRVATAKLPEDVVFEKPTFPSLDLANHLASHFYDRIELVGLVSHICILSNAVMAKAALPNAEIVVYQDGTQSYDADLQEKAFAVLKGLHITVI